MPQRNPLYLMVKPPLPIALEIQGLPETDLRRGVDLLHWTMLRLVLRPGQTVKAIVDALDGTRFKRFWLVFDQLVTGKGAQLIPSGPVLGAERLMAALGELLAKVKIDAHPSWPHVSLDYRDARNPGSRAIDPISWKVGEIVLVESIVGQARHRHLKQWKLLEA